MEVELCLPSDYADYGWEVESKGVLFDAIIKYLDRYHSVTFYDPVRFGQDMEHEIGENKSFALSRVIIIERVDLAHMEAATRALTADFFN